MQQLKDPYGWDESSSQSDIDSQKKQFKERKYFSPKMKRSFQKEQISLNQMNYFNSQKKNSQKLQNKMFSKISKQAKISGGQLVGEGVILLPQYKQKIHPYSNSVLIRMIIPSHLHFSGAQSLGLGSGVIVNIQNKKYIVSFCHNFYLEQTWLKSSAFLKIERKDKKQNKIRSIMQIKQQMINYNIQFFHNKLHKDEPIFIEIQPSFEDVIERINQPDYGLEIIFDWRQIDRQQVYLMGFPFLQNKKTFDMKNIQQSVYLKLCFRKLKLLKLSQKELFLQYSTTTEQGESGGALMVYRKNKYYLIGLHLGSKQNQCNIGVLFRSKIKQTFPQIFVKRDRPIIQGEQSNQSTIRMKSTNKISSKEIQLQLNQNYSKRNITQCRNYGFKIIFKTQDWWMMKYKKQQLQESTIYKLSGINFQKIVDLSLFKTGLTDERLYQFLEKNKFQNLKRISLVANNLQYLSPNFNLMNNIEQLFLDYNPLNEEAAKKIVKIQKLKKLTANFYSKKGEDQNINCWKIIGQNFSNYSNNKLKILFQIEGDEKQNRNIKQVIKILKSYSQQSTAGKIIILQELSNIPTSEFFEFKQSRKKDPLQC